MKNNIWLIGAGPMAVEYAKVLKAQNIEFVTIGRGEESAKKFTEKTDVDVVIGGLDNFIKKENIKPNFAIVSTGVEDLSQSVRKLIEIGTKEILCEKPGGIDKKQIKDLSQISKDNNANVYLGYNRRFYSSVDKLIELIEEDGDITSFNFEFTEWAHIISNLKKGPGVLEHLFLNNSTHVADLAFFIGGKPKEISCYKVGGIDWHPSSSIFSGAGISDKNALFSYSANWESPGRWAVEVLTKKHRYYLKPMEKLQIQNIGSVKVEFVEIDDSIDIRFKPGLYKQTEAFLNGDTSKFITIGQQLELLPIYYNIAGY